MNYKTLFEKVEFTNEIPTRAASGEIANIASALVEALKANPGKILPRAAIVEKLRTAVNWSSNQELHNKTTQALKRAAMLDKNVELLTQERSTRKGIQQMIVGVRYNQPKKS